jgi:hypothetical protein
VACRPASMNALTANRMTSARTVTPGQAATFRDEPGDARSGVVAYERIFAGAGGQSRIELIVLVRDAQALPLMPNSGRCVPVCLCADLYTKGNNDFSSALPVVPKVCRSPNPARKALGMIATKCNGVRGLPSEYLLAKLG